MGSAMEPLCEFCRMVRAVVYCKSDLARLCLQCDGSVHSANALSRRHPRSLLCDKCNSQPAVVRCVYDKMSLCQGCDCNASSGCSGLGHQRQTLTCYTGCPSLAEFSTIWAFVLDAPFSSGFDHNWGALAALPLNENCVNKILEPTDSEGSVGLVASKMNDLETCPNKIEPWLASSVIPPSPNFTATSCRNQAPLIPEEPNLPKGSNLGLPGGDELGKGIDVEDIALTFDSADKIFGCPQGQPNPRYQLEDVGMDCLLMEKNLSATGSNGPIENALEASSSGPQDCMAFQSSPVGGGSVMQAANASNYNLLLNPSCSRSTGLGFPTGQVHSSISLSLSNITGENSAADYQDCGLSPLFMTSESPWESNLEVSCPQARDKAKMRYNEKKKTRTFGKQIRYASRKARADTRKRVKGRFVKVGEAYDYDPLVTRNC